MLSDSGNSPNIVKAIEEAKTIGMTSYAMLGSAREPPSTTLADLA